MHLSLFQFLFEMSELRGFSDFDSWTHLFEFGFVDFLFFVCPLFGKELVAHWLLAVHSRGIEVEEVSVLMNLETPFLIVLLI